MLYSLRSLRYVKLVNWETYESIRNYYNRRERNLAKLPARMLEEREAEMVQGDTLLHPLEWFVEKHKDPSCMLRANVSTFIYDGAVAFE